MTNEEVQKLILRSIDMEGIEDDFKDINGREAEIVLTPDTPQKMRLRLSNPLEEFLIEVRIS